MIFTAEQFFEWVEQFDIDPLPKLAPARAFRDWIDARGGRTTIRDVIRYGPQEYRGCTEGAFAGLYDLAGCGWGFWEVENGQPIDRTTHFVLGLEISNKVLSDDSSIPASTVWPEVLRALVRFIHSRGGRVTVRNVVRYGPRVLRRYKIAIAALDDLETSGRGYWGELKTVGGNSGGHIVWQFVIGQKRREVEPLAAY